MKPERRRLTTSFGISLLLHGLIFALIALQMAQSSTPVLSLSITPITVALSPTPLPEARSMSAAGRQEAASAVFRYKGVSPTTAVVDCAIDREGKLVYATIHEEGPVALFAHVCKESIEEAAPFSPFTFEVPDIYANKDLEIRWTFSFMN